MKENGEYEDIEIEVSDYEGGEQLLIYNEKGELISS